MFPVPTLALILFDSDVYRLHGHADDAAMIQSEEADVFALNKLQCASCYDNVYFSRPDLDVLGMLAQAVRYRRTKKNRQRIFPKEDSPERKSEIIINMLVSVKMPLALSFLRPPAAPSHDYICACRLIGARNDLAGRTLAMACMVPNPVAAAQSAGQPQVNGSAGTDCREAI